MIRDLPTRYPELGRLRLGDRDEQNRPAKLETWRFTSGDEQLIRALAAMFGGEIAPWQPPDGPSQWEVVTEASTLEVLIPPDAVDTAYEAWGRGGRQRRCDGFECTRLDTTGGEPQMVDEPCWCKARNLVPGRGEDVRQGACDMVLRLRVVIPGAPGVGVFILTTGSFYAVTQIPAQVALLEGLRAQGALIPAELAIVPHREKKAWERFAREFFVPELRIRRSLNQLAEIAGGGTGSVAELAAPAAAIERTSSRPSTIGHLPPHVQQVVYACGEAGVSKAQAERLVAHFTGGRSTSRRELTVEEAARIIAVIADGSWRQVTQTSPVSVPGDGDGQPAGTPTATPPAAAPQMPQQLHAALTTIANLPDDLKAAAQAEAAKQGLDVEDWRQLTGEQIAELAGIARVFQADAHARMVDPGDGVDLAAEAAAAGIRPAALLKEARGFAADLGLTPPRAVAEIVDPALVSRVRGWIAEQRQGAA